MTRSWTRQDQFSNEALGGVAGAGAGAGGTTRRETANYVHLHYWLLRLIEAP